MNLDKKIYVLNEMINPIDPANWFNLPHVNGYSTDRVTLEITEKETTPQVILSRLSIIKTKLKLFQSLKENQDILDDKLNLVAIERKSYYEKLLYSINAHRKL